MKPDNIEITVHVKPSTLHLVNGEVVDVYGSSTLEETIDFYYPDITFIKYVMESAINKNIDTGVIENEFATYNGRLRCYIDSMLMPVCNYICGTKNGLLDRYITEATFDSDGYMSSEESNVDDVNVTMKVIIDSQ